MGQGGYLNNGRTLLFSQNESKSNDYDRRALLINVQNEDLTFHGPNEICFKYFAV